jgi:hypothetical protein
MTVATPTDKFGSMEFPEPGRPVYLDCNATTPIDPRVRDEVLRWTAEEFGNAGSRTHTYGQVANLPFSSIDTYDATETFDDNNIIIQDETSWSVKSQTR